MAEQKLWRNKQVADMFGITPRLLIDLTEKGVVRASIDEGGRGNIRGYSAENLFDLALYQELNALKIGYRNIKFVVEQLTKHKQKHTGLLLFRVSPNSLTVWWNIIAPDEIRSAKDVIVSENDNISEIVSAATIIVDLRFVSKMVQLKVK